MGWVVLVDDWALMVGWMEDKQGCQATVTGKQYLWMRQKEVWPEMCIWAGRQWHWWIKDSATGLTTNAVLNFLGKMFWGLVISQRLEIDWPPYSPNLNPLNCFFFSFSMIHIHYQKPVTLDELKAVVDDIALTVPEQVIWDAVANIRKCCWACKVANGGHFEASLKKL